MIRTLLLVFLCFVVFPATAEIEEIYVTAKKRKQSIQDISSVVFALDAATIKNLRIQQVIDFSKFIPNLDIKNTLGNTNPIITIRGVGLNDFAANNEQSAGVYLDEVFMASPAMMSFQVFDVERAEVLLGPQGTLYGRNTTAGAINFISNKPTDDFYTDIELGYGNFERFHTEAVINGAISDTLSGRLSMTGDWSGKGHINNRFTGNDYGKQDRWAARGQLKWTPDNHKEFLLNLYGGHDGSDTLSNWTAVGIVDLNAFAVCAPAVAGDLDQTIAQCTNLQGFQDRDGDPYSGEWNLEPETDIYQYGFSLTTNWNFERSKLTTISAYQGFDRFLQEEVDGSPFVSLEITTDNFIEQFSQELRLSSIEPWELGFLPGELNWIIGGFYHFDNRIGDPSQEFNLRDLFNDVAFVEWEQDTQSAALFTHLGWQFREQWQLVLGGRYTWEEKAFFSNSENTLPFGGVSGLTGSAMVFSNSRDNRISNGNFTGTVSLEYSPADNLLTYLKFSKGFKSGGFSGAFAGSQEELDPYGEEEVFSYEAGVKTTLLAQTLQINAAFFYYDYEGIQAFIIPTNAANPVPRLSNAEEATVLGLDANIIWQPITGLQISNNIGWLDHQNKDPRFDGFDLPNAPKLNYSSIIRYQHEFDNDLSLTPQLHLSYQGETFKTIENNALLISESYWLINARIALQKSDDWEIALWADNLTDKEYVAEAFDQSGQGFVIINFGMPRTYGLSARYRWD